MKLITYVPDRATLLYIALQDILCQAKTPYSDLLETAVNKSPPHQLILKCSFQGLRRTANTIPRAMFSSGNISIQLCITAPVKLLSDSKTNKDSKNQ